MVSKAKNPRRAAGNGPAQPAETRAMYELVAQGFEHAYYARQVPGAEMFTAAQLLEDYVTGGWRNARNPSSEFCVSKYLHAYPDVAASGGEPLYHYLKFGRAEGRKSFPVEPDARAEDQVSRAAASPAADTAKSPDHVAALPFFDESFYLRAYPDIASSGSDPFTHYLDVGWKEGRDPSPEFSTRYYLSSNPDVKEAGLSPLIHYALTGRVEGRQPRHPGGWQAQLLAQIAPLSERAVAWRRRRPSQLLAATSLDELLSKRLNGRQRIVVALGHDRYYENTGGIQACVQEEQLLLNAAGYDYVFINPYQPLPALSTEDVSCWLCDLSIDGTYCGTLTGDDVLAVLGRQLAGIETHLCIHSLLGHNPAWTERLALLTRFATRHFWVHDFFSLCPGFNLLRNDVSFCNAPAIDSNSCRLCVYGEERQMHLKRLTTLFKSVSFDILAPSQSALDLWTQKTQLPYESARVLEHRKLMPRAGTRSVDRKQPKVRVAFLGHPAPHKGWNIFKDLVISLRHDRRYEFYHLGVSSDPALPVTHVPVKFSEKTPDAMQRAIEAHRIDIALVLSIWPETFCLTAYEARAGGATLYAFAQSGNVSAMITKFDAGTVFDSYADLLRTFQDDSVTRQVAAARAKGNLLGDLVSSGISTGVIAPTSAQRGATKVSAHAKPLAGSTKTRPSTAAQAR